MCTIETAAERLRAAYAGAPVAPVRPLFAERDLESAYAVQRWQVERWIAGGRRPAGRKIGITSPAVQRQLGVSEPDFGQLFADMVYGSGEQVSMQRLHQPRAEAEIALILGRDLDMPCVTVADLVGAIAWVLPALEIVGSRIADWDISIVDTIADNASCGVLVLGGTARRVDGLDLVGCAMQMQINGSQVSSGHGRDCLGSPLNAAVWLARKAVECGQPLRAGELVMTGALGAMAAVDAGDHVQASIDGIGEVEVTISP